MSKVIDMIGNNVVVADTPAYGSSGWNDYVMSHFTEDELVTDTNGKKCPKCAGLRRVVRIVLGDVLSSAPINFAPAVDAEGPGRASAIYEVQVKFYSDGIVRRVADGADVWHGNTDDMFAAHPLATAITRAEARVLRKLLLLNNISAEELTIKDTGAAVRNSVKVEVPTKGEMNPDDKMSAAQKNFLDKKCKQINLNVVAMATNINITKPVKEWSKKDASALIDKYNYFQQNGVPPELLKYDPNWSNTND